MGIQLPRLLVVAAASFVVSLVLACSDDGGPVVFSYGVASGDVRPDGAVLWTRADHEATLTLDVATDEAFEHVLVEEKVKAEEDADFTAKAEVTSLEAAQTYYYRFRRGESMSEVGTFRTAPLEGEAAPVRFAFSGDTDSTVREDGTRAFDFKVLDAIRAEDPDFFLFFGDTIYADSAAKATTLDDYRAKYKESREVERMRQVLAGTPVYTIWDDHEVENDFAGTSVDPDLLANGRQAFREYMPISGDDQPEVLYRTFRWGNAVELIVLDERSFRSDDVAAECTPEGAEEPDVLPGFGFPNVPQPIRNIRTAVDLPLVTDPACVAALNDPERTMLGEEQKQFLFDALSNSEATFKIIVNEVPISELFAQPYDRWEGYRAEREELLGFIAFSQIKNVVFLTTDFHANILVNAYVNVLYPSDAQGKPTGPVIAREAIAGPIAHGTFGDAAVEAQGEGADALFAGVLTQVARADCVELDAYAYGLVEVDPAAGTTTITLKDENGAQLCQTVVHAH
ncbi:MAG: alkaline phosphatase D family protein [Dehalococcoidia bacterium]